MARKERTSQAVNRQVTQREQTSTTNAAAATADPVAKKSSATVTDRRNERSRGRRAAAESQRRRRRIQRIALIAGGALLVVIVGAFIYQRATESDVPDDRIETGVATATDPGQFITPMSSQHVGSGTNVTNYNSNPPTSGDHYPSTARWGISDVELDEEFTTHNLEHGGIVINYNCPEGCQDVVDQLTAIVSPYPVKLILSPRSDMEHRIAVTAWTRLLTMEDVNTEQIQAFIDAYIDKGPEKIQTETDALEAAGF
jgi:hypothetical protein